VNDNFEPSRPCRGELTYAEQKQRTEELRQLQNGMAFSRVSAGGSQERGEVVPRANPRHASGSEGRHNPWRSK
jgi:hypothetical protein